MTEFAEEQKIRTPEEELLHQVKKREKMRRHQRDVRMVLPSITISVFVCWLGSTMFVSSHSAIATEFNSSPRAVAIALASYSVAVIAVAVAGGRICDIAGRKRMFIVSGTVFAVAALGTWFVQETWQLLAVRTIMGACSGLILTSTGGILVSTLKGTTRHNAWLLWRGAGMCGMILGPVLGPIISTGEGWRIPILVSAIFMLVAVVLGGRAMQNSSDQQGNLSLELFVPTILLGIGLVTPYVILVLVKEQLANWTFVWALLVVGVLSIFGFLVINRRIDNKLFEQNIVLHNRRLWLTDVFGAIHVGCLFVMFGAYAVLLEAGTTLTPVAVGIGMLALAIPLISVHLLAHRLRERRGLTRQRETVIGSVLLALSAIWLFVIPQDQLTYVELIPSLVLAGAGFGLIRLYGHMGVIKETGVRWSSTLFGTRTFSNHLGAALGAVIIGTVLAEGSFGVGQVDPGALGQARFVAVIAIVIVIVSSAVFSALKVNLLGWEDPHWHSQLVASENQEQ